MKKGTVSILSTLAGLAAGAEVVGKFPGDKLSEAE